jgi:hypothetical protein
VGKNNLYKLFIARSVELLADGGCLSFIVPMAVLGDEQSSGVRKLLLEEGALRSVHAFPQKDDATARVFRDAKLSTALFLYQKSQAEDVRGASFETRAHPAQFIVESAQPLRLNAQSIRLYHPTNLTILSCDQRDWDLLQSLDPARFGRLRDYSQFFQGEVNETNVRAAGHLTDAPNGVMVTRGACVCLYQIREASQGQDLYLNVSSFTASGGPDTKVHHHRYERVVLQESSPQNNFRRIIAARLPSGNFCNHTINYTTSHHSRVSLSLILSVLNSVFAEWYFRLGSTNAHVSQYQIDMIPTPLFGRGERVINADLVGQIRTAVNVADFRRAEELTLALAEQGCGATIEAVIDILVRCVEQYERARGVILRTQRAALSSSGQEIQAILDRAIMALIGFREHYDEVRQRLALML